MITDSASMEEMKTESGGRRPWSDLLNEMVRLILGELAVGGRIRARSVCKNWRLPFDEIPPKSSESELPWIMSFKWDNTDHIERNLSKCKLSDPVYKKQVINSNNGGRSSCAIGIRDKKKFVDAKVCDASINDWVTIIRGKKKFVDAKVCASKNGWVMFYHRSSQKIINSDLFDHETSFFLYNPFTKHAITLPNLITNSYIEARSFDVATFSSSPEDDDCFFFVVGRDLRNICFIATYCRNMEEQNWKIDLFIEDGYRLADYEYNGMRFDRIKGSIYIDGIFYCVTNYGTLTSFNVALREWNYLTNLYPLPDPEDQSPHIFELNGEFLLVYVGYCTFKRLYVFDKSTSVWVSREERYLKDKALFLGSYCSFAVSVDAYDLNKIANKVYQCIEHKLLRYPFISKRDDWEENSEEIFGDIHWKDKTTKIWIQPPSKF